MSSKRYWFICYMMLTESLKRKDYFNDVIDEHPIDWLVKQNHEERKKGWTPTVLISYQETSGASFACFKAGR